MGWASGSRLFTEIIKAIKPKVERHNKRVEIYDTLIAAFQKHDWDTLDECLGIDAAYDEAYEKLYPDEDEDDDASDGGED